jgi:fumarylpyruvate hydrolase
MSHVIAAPAAVTIPVAGGGTFPVRRIYCVGRNYVDHAKEMGFTGREPPFFFMKPADAVLAVAEGEVGRMPYPSLTQSLHHEVELVVALGSGGKSIAAADAMQHIWGYAVGLDMTRRDLQGEAKKLGRPWDIGKGFDHSAPIGPVRRAAECRVDADTRITLEVNGKLRQQSTIGKLIWNIGEIIEHLSSAWELQAGDLIFTGTPEGVAAVERGDTLKAEVSGVGTLQVALV